jgi:hypothetical protein
MNAEGLGNESVRLAWLACFSHASPNWLQVIESSRDGDEGPITFELGAGEIMGNRLFEVIQCLAAVQDSNARTAT